MANEKNLVPVNKRTKSEARKISSKGGKASGEARRQRRALKDSMELLLSMPVMNTKDWNALSRMGFDPDEPFDNSMLIVLGLFNRAKTGDVAAIKELRAMIGEETVSVTLSAAEKLLDGVDSAI